MKSKGRATPTEHAFRAAEMFARRQWLTVAPLALEDETFNAIAEVQDVWLAASGKRRDPPKELEALIDPEQRDSFSDLLGEALTDAKTAAFVTGIAFGLILGRGGQSSQEP